MNFPEDAHNKNIMWRGGCVLKCKPPSQMAKCIYLIFLTLVKTYKQLKN